MASKFTELVVDCSDPSKLAEFWCKVLSYRIGSTKEEYVEIRGPEGGGP